MTRCCRKCCKCHGDPELSRLQRGRDSRREAALWDERDPLLMGLEPGINMYDKIITPDRPRPTIPRPAGSAPGTTSADDDPSDLGVWVMFYLALIGTGFCIGALAVCAFGP